MTKTAMILALAAVTPGCKAEPEAKPDRGAMPDLSASLDAVRSEFNAHNHEARFLTLLAPT